ncbi:MAG TPA: ROK family protein [Terriglobales bacterium]|nr:ROK family protein [Terriglobales bacterium]
MKALSIDLGGTHATCAVIQDKQIVASEVVDSDSGRGLGSVLPQFADTLRKLAKQTDMPLSQFAGVALSFCGMVNTKETRVTSTNQKYDDATAIDFCAWSQREFGLNFRIENDARMALLGEWYAGGAQGFDNVVMFTLGTGIGGAAMIEGRLLRGKHHQAGCLGGHFPALFNGRKCTCGAIGCAEAEAAGWSLPFVCRETPGFESSQLSKEPSLNFECVFRLAKAGDSVALAVRDRCIRVWSANTVAAIHAFDPEVVVYGGGVMRSADVILPAIQAYVNEHAWTPWGKVQVHAAQLGNNAGLLGAIPLLSEGHAVGVA